jgi:hypothetical protein
MLEPGVIPGRRKESGKPGIHSRSLSIIADTRALHLHRAYGFRISASRCPE